MAKFVAGAIFGSFVVLLALSLFAGLLYLAAERELVRNWRQIRPGMARAEVERILGAPDYDVKPDIGFPEWAEKSVPNDYYLNHGLLVFTIGRIGPQLLLVYLDDNGTSSWPSVGNYLDSSGNGLAGKSSGISRATRRVATGTEPGARPVPAAISAIPVR